MVLYFGVDIDAMLQAWFSEIFIPELREKYGEDVKLAAIILGALPLLDVKATSLSELPHQHILVTSGDLDVVGSSEGLVANVEHKLEFVLRTGLPSSFARQRPDLVEPGDFPWAGAGIYKSYPGGVSGLNEESDWWAYERIVDKLIELRSAAAEAAIAASKARAEGWRYLEGDGRPPSPEKAINN